MKINIKASIRRICAVALPFALLAPLRAVEPTPWDSMNASLRSGHDQNENGENSENDGQCDFHERPTSCSLRRSLSIPRQQVKEVVIRSPRPGLL